MKSRSALRIVVGLALVLGLTAGVRATLTQIRGTARELPTARVRRGDLDIKVYTSGELRPSRSVNMMAPPVSGSLQIIHLATTGVHLKAGDSVVEFDTSEQEYKLEQARSQFDEADQQMTKSRADTAVTEAEDQVNLLKARFDVRRAELDVSRNELLSAIDAQKNNLALDEAKRRLAQLEQDIHSREASNKAALAVLEEKRNKASLDIKQAQTAIENMRLRTTLDGVVVIKENADAVGGWIPPGVVAPEYREGDAVRPGRIVAEVLQVENMQIEGKINEADRANVNSGQIVKVQVDAVPGVVLDGHVTNIASVVSMEWGPQGAHSYAASFQLDKADPRLRSGQTAQVIIEGDKVKDALFLPRQVLFDQDGKPVLYVKSGSRFEPREVKISHRTESQITVEGLNEGDEVALVSPETFGKEPAKSAPVGPALGGGQ